MIEPVINDAVPTVSASYAEVAGQSATVEPGEVAAPAAGPSPGGAEQARARKVRRTYRPFERMSIRTWLQDMASGEDPLRRDAAWWIARAAALNLEYKDSASPTEWRRRIRIWRRAGVATPGSKVYSAAVERWRKDNNLTLAALGQALEMPASQLGRMIRMECAWTKDALDRLEIYMGKGQLEIGAGLPTVPERPPVQVRAMICTGLSYDRTLGLDRTAVKVRLAVDALVEEWNRCVRHQSSPDLDVIGVAIGHLTGLEMVRCSHG